MLLHLKQIMFVYWMIFLCTFYAVDSAHDGSSRFERTDNRRLFPLEEHEFSLIGSLRRAPKHETKLRTVNDFNKRVDFRNSAGIDKRVDSKIKKLQLGALRTAIGFGKRSFKYSTQETDPTLLQKIGPSRKEIYPLEWYYEDSRENDPGALVRIIRKFQEMKHNTNDEACLQTDETDRPYPYTRFSASTLNLDDEQ